MSLFSNWRSFLLFAALTAPVAGCATDAEEAASGSGDELINGTVVGPNDFPGVFVLAPDFGAGPPVLHEAGYHPYCTATLVSPKNFVTAGHCILNLVGNQPQSQMRPGQALWISNAVGPVHPWRRVTIVATSTELEQFVAAGNGYAFNVQGGRLVHDLGAVRIAEPQPDRPAVLDFERVRRGDRLTMVGYGCTARTGSQRWGEGIGWKLAGELAVAAEYGRTFTAGGNAVSPNATAGCPGDSGGPVFRKGSVVGVNSSINWDASGRVVQTVFGRIDVGDTTTPYDSRGWLLQTLERFDRL